MLAGVGGQHRARRLMSGRPATVPTQVNRVPIGAAGERGVSAGDQEGCGGWEPAGFITELCNRHCHIIARESHASEPFVNAVALSPSALTDLA